MPELPEVETIKRGLDHTILGKKIKNVEVRLPKIISLGPETVSNIRSTSAKVIAEFQKVVTGFKISKVSRRAKIIILDLSGPYTILIHLKLTGQLIFAKKGEKKEVKIYNEENVPKATLPHKYTHAIFHFTDGSNLYFNDLRQFGYIKLVRDEEVSQVKELEELGPEPFAREFTFEYLLEKAKRRSLLTIKQFLMDPKIVTGIGNIYSDEILFWAKLRPTRRLRSLKKQDFEVIVKNTRKVLEAALKAHGSSVEYFFQVNGSEGRYALEHMVYGRYGEPCKKCGSKIEKLKIGGRTSCYCPKCQK